MQSLQEQRCNGRGVIKGHMAKPCSDAIIVGAKRMIASLRLMMVASLHNIFTSYLYLQSKMAVFHPVHLPVPARNTSYNIGPVVMP